MPNRNQLQEELETFTENVYFQPPSNVQMKYPCIIYSRTGKNRHYANNFVYLSQQGFKLTVVTRDPDCDIADRLENHFQHCVIDQYYTVDNLNHTTLQLFY